MFHRFSTLFASAWFAAAACLFGASAASLAAAPAQENIQVEVDRHDEVVFVDARLVVPVSRHLAFEVLTDYDRMQRFLPNLKESRVLERSGNRLVVSQSGAVAVGPFAIPFDYVRQVDLQTDARIQSRVLSGSLKKADVTTSLTERDGQTQIMYESEAVPDIWIPFGISTAVIANQVRQQLVHMRDEMIRRDLARRQGRMPG